MFLVLLLILTQTVLFSLRQKLILFLFHFKVSGQNSYFQLGINTYFSVIPVFLFSDFFSFIYLEQQQKSRKIPTKS